MRISLEKSRVGDELGQLDFRIFRIFHQFFIFFVFLAETFLIRLQEMQMEEALNAIDWDKNLQQMTISFRFCY